MKRTILASMNWAMAGVLAAALVSVSPARAADAGRNNHHGGQRALLANTGNDNTAIGDLTISPESSCFRGSGGANACCRGPGTGVCGSDGSQCNACCSGMQLGNCGTGNTGNSNTGVGYAALQFNRTGTANTAAGSEALRSNISGSNNTAIGEQALKNNSIGNSNTAVGQTALQANTIGNYNTAAGAGALKSNTTGTANTAAGYQALQSNISGNLNTAAGYGALSKNTTGSSNTAVGTDALQSNEGSDRCMAATMPYACCDGQGSGKCGSNNSALGWWALGFNRTGSANTAIGVTALFINDAGNNNVAVGYNALASSRDGDNTAVGTETMAGFISGSNNTAVGAQALNANSVCTGAGMPNVPPFNGCCLGPDLNFCQNSGDFNIALGKGAGQRMTSGDANIYIGNPAPGAESNTIRIGVQQPAGAPADTTAATATYIAGISNGIGNGTGVAVFVDSDGGLSPEMSSARFKKDIEDMGDSSEGLMKLRPVRFRYKREIDPSGLQQYGLVAEEVAQVYPGLVVRDDQGQPQTVRYHFVYAMMLNELQKQSPGIETLDALVQPLKAQQGQIKDLATRVEHLETLLSQASTRARAASNTAGPSF